MTERRGVGYRLVKTLKSKIILFLYIRKYEVEDERLLINNHQFFSPAMPEFLMIFFIILNDSVDPMTPIKAEKQNRTKIHINNTYRKYQSGLYVLESVSELHLSICET